MSLRLAPVTALAVLAGCPADESHPTGIALIRVSEVAGPCPIDTLNGHARIPTDLPFRRAKATAAFRASERFDGGHIITVGYQDEDARLGHIDLEVPAERGYGIADYRDQVKVQAAGFAEWQGGTLLYAGERVDGYLNYFSAQGSDLPGKVYALLAFDAIDGCRIVAVHASAEVERVTPFDPTWLVPRPGLLITNQGGTQTTPAFDDLNMPGTGTVPPQDAPADPGEPAPAMPTHGPNAFSDGGGGDSPCD